MKFTFRLSKVFLVASILGSLGISGGYFTDAKKIALPKDDDIGGIYWTEPFNNKKVDEQFEAYFEER